jgi:hypothetical protein
MPAGKTVRTILWATAGILLILPIVAAMNAAAAPRMALGALVGIAAVTCWRPALTLALLTAIVPIGPWIGRHWYGQFLWTDTLVLAFASGAAVHCAFQRDEGDQPDRQLGLVCWTMAVIVAASWLVDLSLTAQLQKFAGIGGWLRTLSDGALTGGMSPAGFAASILLRGLLLFAAAAHYARTDSRFRVLFPRMAVIGAVAAGVLTIARLFEAAMRFPNVRSVFFGYLVNLRFNALYGDLNAAGTSFVLPLFIALALAIAAPGLRRLAWAGCAAIIGIGVWTSGSRAAMLCGVAACAIPASRLALRNRPALRGKRSGIIAAIVVVVLGLAIALAASLPGRQRQSSPLLAVRIRIELTKTSLRMLAAHPLLGIGVGQYHARSGEFSSPALIEMFPPARNENAHNNFLQIAAELGLAGFCAFAGILWLTARRVSESVPRSNDIVLWGIAAGVFAHVLTWLGGHPLLIPEVAYSFWLALGTATGWAGALAPPPAQPSRRVLAWSVGALVLVLAIAMPWRVRAYTADANLEHVGIGVLPHWETAADGVRYRWAGPHCSVFVPADARAFTLRLRAPSAATFVHVELRLDGKTADRVRVDADRWTTVTEPLPPSRGRTRFLRLDLIVLSPDAVEQPRFLMIGKVEPL